MHYLFLDESGECSFSDESIYKHFLATVLSVNDDDNKKFKTILKYRAGSLIKRGWDKKIEIKATTLYNYKKFGIQSIKDILEALIKIPSLEVSYIVVNKENINSDSLTTAPYGIAYNYFTGVLLSELVFLDGMHDIHLTYDKRNKETHANKPFREYLQTTILGKAFESSIKVNFVLEGKESNMSYGLKAVDFFSWSIFRKFERNDDSLFNIFRSKLKRRREWYL